MASRRSSPMVGLWLRFGWAVGLGLASCAGSGEHETGSLARSKRVVWVERPPAECAVGSSGPTLNPRDAIRSARFSAIEALAADGLAIEIRSVGGVGADGEGFEISAQALSGTLADARIVALWADTDPSRGARSRLRQVFALACWPDADLHGLPPSEHPVWLLSPPRDGGRICAVGIAGPTRRPEDQAPRALVDARLALALALESRIEKRVFDDGRGNARIAREIEPSAAAIARAEQAEALSATWLDAEGVGPLGLPRVLYGLACISA